MEAMASIRGELPHGLQAIHERFGEKVEFQVFDRRGGIDNVVEWEGWEHVSLLESEGTYEHLKRRLHTVLDRHEAEGVFGADAIAQARGLAPRARNAELYPADGREPAQPRSGESKGTAQEGLNDPDEAKAVGALARGIEADQARLRDQSIGERYQAALQTYLSANTQRIERIENRLEILIENQRAALGELENRQPGFLASRRAKAEWSADIESAQDRLLILNNRLSRLEEIKKQAEELAEEKMRDREPELAKAWDAARVMQRGQQELERRQRQMDRQVDRSRDQGRELELLKKAWGLFVSSFGF